MQTPAPSPQQCAAHDPRRSPEWMQTSATDPSVPPLSAAADSSGNAYRSRSAPQRTGTGDAGQPQKLCAAAAARGQSTLFRSCGSNAAVPPREQGSLPDPPSPPLRRQDGTPHALQGNEPLPASPPQHAPSSVRPLSRAPKVRSGSSQASVRNRNWTVLQTSRRTQALPPHTDPADPHAPSPTRSPHNDRNFPLWHDGSVQ